MSSAPTDQPGSSAASAPEAPWPGSHAMPRWNVGKLIDAPKLARGAMLLAMLGPGLVMGASAIGGGEWLLGPAVTAKYGGALLWLATISILSQVLYNIEISRYTLYCGEPIFNGKFRTLPGPAFWLIVYIALDFGAIFPYLAANAATPVAVVLKQGELPKPDAYRPVLDEMEKLERRRQAESREFSVEEQFKYDQLNAEYQAIKPKADKDWWLMKILANAILVGAALPLVFGGKVFNALKAVMSFKLIVVVGFLLFLGVLYSRPASWGEIITGFFRFGTVPVKAAAAPAPQPPPVADPAPATDPTENQPGGAAPAAPKPAFKIEPGVTENVFVKFFTEGKFPTMDFALIAYIAALAAIAGNGGLTNTPISNLTRDQGWGMGHHVGAIPSMIGGRGITLSPTGCVFIPDEESLPRWQRWRKHVIRDQTCIWMVACFIGVALPSLLSVEFLERGTTADRWNMAALTADGVQRYVASPKPGTLVSWLGLGPSLSFLANPLWAMTLLCGFLVLATSMTATIDGFIRRWVDVFWTAQGAKQRFDPERIRYIYFWVLLFYMTFGSVMLWLTEPTTIIAISTTIYNFALAFSSLHTLVVNCTLLPPPLRPSWLVRVGMSLSFVFFLTLGTVSSVQQVRNMQAEAAKKAAQEQALDKDKTAAIAPAPRAAAAARQAS